MAGVAVRYPLTTTAPDARFRLHYMDDSGSAESGLASFTWLQFPPAVWAGAQQIWLAFRQDLHARHGIPASRRLHATDLAGGRRNPSSLPGWDVRRHGPGVIRDGLRVIGGIGGLSVGTVYRRAEPGRLADAKRDLYRRLVVSLDADLRDRQLMGMVFMDGDGSDRSYTAAHRTLPVRRHLIEEPVFRHASADQWVQMADLAAWSAFQSLHRRPGKRRASSWYRQILGPVDAHGGPVEL